MMWRAFVLLLIANPSRLSSLPYRIGVGLYAVQDIRLITYTALQLPFNVDSDSSNQNTMDFVAVVLGLLLAWRTKLTNFYYDFHGDNIS
jgi:hypothetical protein